MGTFLPSGDGHLKKNSGHCQTWGQFQLEVNKTIVRRGYIPTNGGLFTQVVDICNLKCNSTDGSSYCIVIPFFPPQLQPQVLFLLVNSAKN